MQAQLSVVVFLFQNQHYWKGNMTATRLVRAAIVRELATHWFRTLGSSLGSEQTFYEKPMTLKKTGFATTSNGLVIIPFPWHLGIPVGDDRSCVVRLVVCLLAGTKRFFILMVVVARVVVVLGNEALVILGLFFRFFGLEALEISVHEDRRRDSGTLPEE
jgi:hypothetical protein